MPQNEHGMFSADVPFPPASSGDRVRRLLWLYFSGREGFNSTLMVDGEGTSARVVEADIGATDGVIHVVDAVLGVPAQNLRQKLAGDPMLSSAFSLGQQAHFNDRLADEERRFTYLVPSNSAWEALRREFATAHKQLFMGRYAYQSTTVLEGHIRMGEALSMAELVNRTEEEGGVQMLRGFLPLKFSLEDAREGGGEGGASSSTSSSYLVYFDFWSARVIRPDLRCTNGYVHVIDRVLMRRRDVVPHKSAAVAPAPAPTLQAAAAAAALVALAPKVVVGGGL